MAPRYNSTVLLLAVFSSGPGAAGQIPNQPWRGVARQRRFSWTAAQAM